MMTKLLSSVAVQLGGNISCCSVFSGSLPPTAYVCIQILAGYTFFTLQKRTCNVPLFWISVLIDYTSIRCASLAASPKRPAEKTEVGYFNSYSQPSLIIFLLISSMSVKGSISVVANISFLPSCTSMVPPFIKKMHEHHFVSWFTNNAINKLGCHYQGGIFQQ